MSALKLGIGGPVGSGKTALVAELCRRLGDELEIAAVTNDIFTREDAEFLQSVAVGGSPPVSRTCCDRVSG